MLGRGMVSDPGLALAIARPGHPPLAWETLMPLLHVYWELVGVKVEPRHRAGRLKQWLNYLRRRYPEAEALYATVRTVNAPLDVARIVFGTQRAPLEEAVTAP
jgi:tRNA-dihydrouridine synthase C